MKIPQTEGAKNAYNFWWREAVFRKPKPPIIYASLLVFLTFCPWGSLAQRVEVVKPLYRYGEVEVSSVVGEQTLLLNSLQALELFLEDLDGGPPEWRSIYGSGDDAHMERLFDVNRARDRGREGRPELGRRVAFVWEGVVTRLDPKTGGLRLAIGPKKIKTGWGVVRFKPYGLPPGLVAVPEKTFAEELQGKKDRGETIDIDLWLVGHLIPDEPIIYGFAHEEPGQGMVMPVVAIEQIEYFLTR